MYLVPTPVLKVVTSKYIINFIQSNGYSISSNLIGLVVTSYTVHVSVHIQ